MAELHLGVLKNVDAFRSRVKQGGNYRVAYKNAKNAVSFVIGEVKGGFSKVLLGDRLR